MCQTGLASDNIVVCQTSWYQSAYTMLLRPYNVHGTTHLLAFWQCSHTYQEARSNINDKILLQDQVQGALLQGAHLGQPLQLSQGPLIQQHTGLTELQLAAFSIHCFQNQHKSNPESATVSVGHQLGCLAKLNPAQSSSLYQGVPIHRYLQTGRSISQYTRCVNPSCMLPSVCLCWQNLSTVSA